MVNQKQKSLLLLSLKPPTLGCLTAAVFAAFPDRVHFVQPLTLDLDKLLPGHLGPLTVWAYVALVGFVLGFGFGKGLSATRRILLRRLFADQGWMLQPKSTRTKIWALLVKLMKGPKPYSTFEFQRMLPSQPVPPLDQTLDHWLTVNSHWLSEEELMSTKEAVNNFRNNQGPVLQRHLQKRASREVSWLHEYWLSAAYLANRDPLPINSNYFSVMKLPYRRTTSDLARAATVLNLVARFSEMVEEETLEPVQLQGLVPLCMNGCRSISNTARIPGEITDNVVRYTGQHHIVVIRNGQYFMFDLMAPSKSGTKTVLTAMEIKTQLEKILKLSKESTGRCDVAALTTQNRTQWAKDREVLMAANQTTLQRVESAMLVLCLDEHKPKDLTEMSRIICTGTGADRWFDKGVNMVQFGEGTMGYNIEHSSLDGMVMVTATTYQQLHECFADDGDVVREGAPRTLPAPQRLKWNVDGMEKRIAAALMEYQERMDDLGLVVVNAPYGKGFMKKQRLSPDGYIQMAMQLAFYRLHKKIPKTYEPSTGRLFALGRTETVHVMSTYSEQWVKSMDDSSASPETKRQLLKKAIECQTNFRLQATRGQGCDRHLLGLFMASRELGMDVPQIFMDKAWRSPHLLSTSQTPTEVFNLGCNVDFHGNNGGFGPSCHDGYGVCYIIHGDDIIVFTITTFKSSEESDLEKFCASLHDSFEDMKQLYLAKT